MSREGVYLMQEAAQSSAAADWTSQPRAEASRWRPCGTLLVSRGKRKRSMQSTGEAQVELERIYGTCPTPHVGHVPLDKGWGLLAGNLTPLGASDAGRNKGSSIISTYASSCCFSLN
jgi:hypothetical protein